MDAHKRSRTKRKNHSSAGLIAESLRTIPCSPEVRAAVFLCFRVVLVRMSAAHAQIAWPLIITEMVQIFSDLEQELSTDSEEWR